MPYIAPKCREAWDLRGMGECLQAATTTSYWPKIFCDHPKTLAQATIAGSKDSNDFQSYTEKVLWFRYYQLHVTGKNCDPEIKLRITAQDSKQPVEVNESPPSRVDTKAEVKPKKNPEGLATQRQA